MTPSAQPSALELARLVELGEAEAYADMFKAAPAELGLRSERIGQAVALFAPQLPIFMFNRVIGLGLEEAVGDDVLEQVTKRFAGSPVYGVQLGPDARVDAQTLERHGLKPSNRWAKMYRAATAADVDVQTDLEVVRLTPERADEFARVVCTAHGMPAVMEPWTAALVSRANWHTYAALDGNQIVSCGAMFVRDEVAWLGLGGTLETHRRRGAQGAIMARRIRDAASFGCHHVITETGESTPERPNPSFHNMVRTGFQLAYQRQNYIFKASR